MAKKLAIDWDDGELRLVAGHCTAHNVKVTDAAVIPIRDGDVRTALRQAIASRGLQETPALVAIGRGRAELRELQLPPVPDDELPAMVRFQAIRSFASAGENATVDYLVTNRKDEGIEMIAAAVTPASLKEIQSLGESAGVPIERISLRPLSAAALYLIHHTSSGGQDTVLIDLLSDDAEIVVARQGRVIFVRTVRMPSTLSGRGRALAGELKRSLVACGSSGSLDRVVLWGKQSVHADDLQMLAEASGAPVQALDPFSLAEVDRKLIDDLPEHVGRLAPLVGLLAADDSDGNRLIDFLNPRKKVEEVPSPYRKAALYGVPAAAALLIAGAVYFQLKGLDQQIADLKASNAAMKSDVDAAGKSVQRTETIDQYLDGDVNWLNEIRRMASLMPASDEMIVRQISGTADPRKGGGTLNIEGAVTRPSVIEAFEASLRDDNHRVTGDGASEQRTNDAYRWGFVESISITPTSVRNGRYEAIANLLAAERAPAGPSEAPAAQTETETKTETGTETDAIRPESTDPQTNPVETTPVEETISEAIEPADTNDTQPPDTPLSEPAEEPANTTTPETAPPAESEPESQPEPAPSNDAADDLVSDVKSEVQP